MIWTGEMMADNLARFDPKTQTWVEYRLPTHYSSVRRIEVDQSGPNRVWFAQRGVGIDKVGYLELPD
jgi:streptogramin lyase